jgi:hypothetical protein
MYLPFNLFLSEFNLNINYLLDYFIKNLFSLFHFLFLISMCFQVFEVINSIKDISLNLINLD